MVRSIHELSQDIDSTVKSGDETAIVALFDELIQYSEQYPQDVEALLGWGVLVGCESQLQCVGKYVSWFLDEFPESVLPVKIEYAEFLARVGQFDDATQLAREYLRLILDGGYLSNLEEFANVRAGASKAFLILTAAHTHVGARSYSERVLTHATRYALRPEFSDHYQVEIQRLRDELRDADNARLNERWEQFFRDGTNADQLFKHCQQCDCDMLARRVDLLEGNFRFRSDFLVDDDEFLQLVGDVRTQNNAVGQALV